MDRPSRKLFRDDIARIVAKGAARIAADELDLGSLFHNIVKSARTTTVVTGDHISETKVRAKDFGETLLSIVRSLDSFGDLQKRVKEHRGEFGDAARIFSQHLHVALQHLVEPNDDRSGTQDGTIYEIAVRADDDNEELLADDETDRPQGPDA